MKKLTKRGHCPSRRSRRCGVAFMVWLAFALASCSRTLVAPNESSVSGGGDQGDAGNTGGSALGSCGDGEVDADEQCDPPGDIACEDLELGSGQAQCSSACMLDTSSCESTVSCAVSQSAVTDACVQELCECDPVATSQCDQGCFDTIACALANCPTTDVSCVLANCTGTFSSALLQLEPCVRNSSECRVVSPPLSGCGDGVINLGEDCDGSAPSCEALGLGEGTVQCDPTTCTFIVDDCELGNVVCGDAVAQDAEQCDGADLMGQSCKDRGFVGGTLSCTDDCKFDTSECHLCGDGVREDPERCDGEDLGGRSCVDLGYSGGSLACLSTCADFDASGCAVCGNGVVEEGEACDGSLLPGDCSAVGLGTGNLACSSSDCRLVTTGCSDAGSCGDGVVETGEACDGSNLLGQSCTSLGFASGSLSCNPTTCNLVTVDCVERDPSECIAVCIDSRCSEVVEQCAATPNCPEVSQCADGCRTSIDTSCVVIQCAINLDINAAALAFLASDCVSDCNTSCQ